MKKWYMGLLGLMVALVIAPATAMAVEEPPPPMQEASGIVVEAAVETEEALVAASAVSVPVEAVPVAAVSASEVPTEGMQAENTQVDGAVKADVEAAKDAQAAEQVVDAGGETEAVGEGDVDVAISKTIEATGIENYFDITLTVETTEPVEDNSTAVVIVMDVSNTMNADENGRSPGEAGFTQSRLVNAQLAVDEFIRQYCEDAGLSPNRLLGVVTFNTDARWADGLQMQPVSAESVSALQDGIALITAPSTPSEVRFTNIEAGLLLARNALDNLTAAYKYVILLTDGFPTTYVDRGIEGNVAATDVIQGYDPYEPGAYQATEVGSDGYFADAVLELPCTYGTSYSDKAAIRASEAAAAMKSGDESQSVEGINIFSVGIAIGSQTIQSYVDHATSSFSIVDRVSDSYAIGGADDPSAYAEWLASGIAGGPRLDESAPTYANGDNFEQLNAAFAEILDSIKATSGLPFEDAFVVDPMGENIEFQYFYDADGAPAVELIGDLGISEDGVPFENTASFDVAKGELDWNLMKSGYSVSVDDSEKRTYTYELTYRVRLANEATGFSYGADVPATGTAVLKYKTNDVWNDPVAFKVPVVKGFGGELNFVKVDQDSGLPIAGALFELAHAADCPECAAAVASSSGLSEAVQIDSLVEASGSNGVVSFRDVPSGHAYVLIELEPALGYLPLEEEYAVQTSYGSTSVRDDEGAVVFKTDVAESFSVSNKAIEVPPVDPPDTPDVPDVPGTPDVPDVPDTPDTPDAPDVPTPPESETPSKPVAPPAVKPSLPQTGDTPLFGVFALVALISLAIGAIGFSASMKNRMR